MRKIFFSLLIGLLFIQPLVAFTDDLDSEEGCCHIDEHLVVDFPQDERERWECTDKMQLPEGLFSETWVFEKGRSALHITTFPWSYIPGDDQTPPAIEDVVDGVLLQENERDWEIISVDNNEALLTYTWENQELFIIRIIITPFALHTVNFYTQGEDIGFEDQKRMLFLVKECCYLVY